MDNALKVLIALIIASVVTGATVLVSEAEDEGPSFPVFDAWMEGRPARVCAHDDVARMAVTHWNWALLYHNLAPGMVFADADCDLTVRHGTLDEVYAWCGGYHSLGCYWPDGRAYGVTQNALEHEIGHALGMQHGDQADPVCQPDRDFYSVMNVLMLFACYRAGL